jgi:hypothetical protein
MKSRAAHGSTLIEVMVAMVLALMLFGQLWSIFRGENRRFHKDQARLGAIEGTLSLDGWLAQDLDRLVCFLPDDDHRELNLDQPVRLDRDGTRLRMMISREAAAPGHRVPTALVTYQLDPATGRVLRTEDDRTREIPLLRAEALRFSLAPVPLTAPGPDERSGAPLLRAAATVMLLRCEVTAISQEQHALPAKDRDDSARVTVVSCRVAAYREQRVEHSYWMFNASELLEEPVGQAD